jgi:hypothetical protein
MPYLIQVSTIIISIKMPHVKYALSYLRSLYATKRGYASIATQQSADPLVSLQSKQFPRRETACAHSLNLRNPLVAVNTSFRPAPPNCNRVADPVIVPSSICARLPTPPLSCIESFCRVLTPLPATPK